MLTKRLTTSIILISTIVWVIFFAPVWIYSSVVTLLIFGGLYEFFAMVRKKGIFVYRYTGVILGTLVPIVMHWRFGHTLPDIEPFLIVIIALLVFVIQFTMRDNSQALSGVSVTIFGIFYVSLLFSYVIKLRLGAHGAALVGYLIAVTKSCDIGAYLIGSAYGRHSLIPRISPKKSVEGMVGGVATSVAVSCALGIFFPWIPFYHFPILGVILALLGQTGDLSESLIKRDCGVKDSGVALPGLGGVLDLLDSLLFTVPIFYIYVKMVLLR